MSTEETRRIVDLYFQRSGGHEGLDNWLDLLAEDARVRDPAAQLHTSDGSIIVQGRKAIKNHFEWVEREFPSDNPLVPIETIIEGEWAAVEWSTEGLHGIKFKGVDLMHIRHGKIQEIRVYFDIGEATRKS